MHERRYEKESAHLEKQVRLRRSGSLQPLDSEHRENDERDPEGAERSGMEREAS